jgi:hypothetical protein
MFNKKNLSKGVSNLRSIEIGYYSKNLKSMLTWVNGEFMGFKWNDGNIRDYRFIIPGLTNKLSEDAVLTIENYLEKKLNLNPFMQFSIIREDWCSLLGEILEKEREIKK